MRSYPQKHNPKKRKKIKKIVASSEKVDDMLS